MLCNVTANFDFLTKKNVILQEKKGKTKMGSYFIFNQKKIQKNGFLSQKNKVDFFTKKPKKNTS